MLYNYTKTRLMAIPHKWRKTEYRTAREYIVQGLCIVYKVAHKFYGLFVKESITFMGHPLY
jgi:hypothetical protein